MSGEGGLPHLTPSAARIFRLTHRDNLPWIFTHGLHCRNSGAVDPAFVPIGLTDLISRRHLHPLPAPFGGTLGDYVPFYFTPRSVMAFNIRTGRNVAPVANTELVFVVSSLPRLHALNIAFVFTDQHAYAATARYYSGMDDLHRIDWALLQNIDFKRDERDPGKLDRYQAEALVRGCVPIEAVSGIVCHDAEARGRICTWVREAERTIEVAVRPRLYFQ